jgi:hypothetical protein
MPNEERIKRILRESVRPGRRVSEQQLTEVVGRITRQQQVTESQIATFANEAIGDPQAFVLKAIDMSDINGELKR